MAKSRIIVMMGLPGSGKSTIAKKLKESMEKVVLLSSDDIREEMFGDRQDVEHHGEVFEELHKRAKEALKQGIDVIYDATNINSKRRIGFLRQLPKGVTKELYFVNQNIVVAKERDKKREFSVGEEVIDRMYKGLQVPYQHEQWDKITVDLGFDDIDDYVYEYAPIFREKISEMTTRLFTYGEFVDVLNICSLIEVFNDMIGLPQDNPHHTFTVDKHTYYVYEYIFNNYHKEDREDLIIASIFHDIGKPYCKTFDQGLRYARYFGHDNVGGQLTLMDLMLLGYPQERALKIASLVGLHMRKSFDLDYEGDRKLEKLVGEDTFIKLNYIRQADIQAR